MAGYSITDFLVLFFVKSIQIISVQAGQKGLETAPLQIYKSSLFSLDEFHYLRVPRVAEFTAYNDLHCALNCLDITLCFSINMAVVKSANGKIWCELLSSDKYRNYTEYGKNKSSHHLTMLSPCIFLPCKNGGTCIANERTRAWKCHCTNASYGEYCENDFKSCKDAYDLYRSNVSQVVTLFANTQPASIFCHMEDFGCGDGGWTPVMKIDGSKTIFGYNASYWSNKNVYNLLGGETGFDSRETKLSTYWKTPFSKICLGMKIGKQTNFIVINKKASSLFSLIADGSYIPTSLGRETWKKLIGSQASLQKNCNKEGFNVESTLSFRSKARIGILGNEGSDGCDSCDSRIGFGTAGSPDENNSCGNEASATSDNGSRHIKAMGYILVQ
ncbi:uncharacterized protein LOC111346325 [Stylophora pistillata]|uniref:uncharacterized protein LOC111346325 n=1 Tax=Stylophora pistillata TaxID=50429 RepID=UPI000C04B909|nr:uncharacterized protein LOC111346325 [Stylophora pistillata]